MIPLFVIVPMTVEDLPQVMAIENASFTSPFSENLFRMELNLNIARLFVVKKGEEVLGYIDYWSVEREVHLITIAVHPSFRGRHIGTSLIEWTMQEARKDAVEQISLDVRPSNEPALGLYQKFGFQEVGRRKRYYQDNNEDAVIMSLRLHA